MASAKLRLYLVAACVATTVGGCRSVPPPPDAITMRAEGPADLSSRPPAGRYYDPAVAQATADEPVAPGPTPDEALAAATGNSRVRLKDDKKKDDDFFDPGGWIDDAAKSIKAWTGHGPSEDIARKAFEDGKELFRQERTRRPPSNLPRPPAAGRKVAWKRIPSSCSARATSSPTIIPMPTRPTKRCSRNTSFPATSTAPRPASSPWAAIGSRSTGPTRDG